MGWQYTPYALLSLATALLSGALAVYAARRRGVPGARMGALFMAAVAVWTAANAVELGVAGLSQHLLWSGVAYVGIVTVPVAWFGFAAGYTGRERLASGRNLALLFVVPVLTLLALLTTGYHGLFWSGWRLDTSGPFVGFVVEYGPLFWVWISYAYALLLAGVVMVVRTLARAGTLYGRQGAVLLVGAAAPWVGNVVHILDLSPIPNLDPTPFCFLVTGGAIAYGISRFGLLDVVPVARAAVVEGMDDGVIVLDSRNRVLDANPAAGAVCAVPPDRALGLPIEEVVGQGELLREILAGGEGRRQVRVGGGPGHREYEVTLSTLGRGGREPLRFVVVRDVTLRVARELAFRLIVENASDVVQIYEPDASFRYVSPSIGRVLGYGPEEAEGLGNASEGIHPDEAEAVLRRFGEIWETPGINAPISFRMRHRDGSWRHMEGVLNNLLEDPEVGGVVASWRDVTGRVEAEEEVRRLNAELEGRVIERTAELKESEEKYRSIFENAVEGIFQITPEGRLVTANPAMARIFGYDSPEDLLASVPEISAGLLSADERGTEFVETMRRHGSVSGFEVGVRRRDGTAAWVSVGARSVRDGSGRLVGYEGLVEDITARRGARRTLERRVAALTSIAAGLTLDRPLSATLDSLAAGVVETTAAVACSVYLVEDGSPTLAGLSGLPPGYWEATRNAWRSGRPSPAREAFESRGPVLREEDTSGLDGAHPGTVHVTPLVARGEALGVINAYHKGREAPEPDAVTFLKAVADQAAIAVENARLYGAARGAAVLQERQRISRELHDSVSQALYGIALGSRTARTLLDRDPAKAAEPLDYVHALAEAGLAEMRALIFELRPEALETEGLVAALGRQAAALRARHGIEVHLEPSPEPAMPAGAKEVLYRIAQEALQNTVKHAGATRAGISLRPGPDAVELTVWDDGAGFDPSGRFPGHLGLSTMRERAENLGGSLEIESSPAAGTRVKASVPPHDPEEPLTDGLAPDGALPG